MNATFNTLNEQIVRAKTKGRVPSSFYEAKDAVKDAKEHMHNTLHGMNKEVANMRDKIGRECGQRGQEWWRNIVGNRNIRAPWL